MTTPRSIIHLAQSILTGMAPRLDGALARIDELADVQDGYPTSVIGAGPATGGNPPRHTCDTHPEDCAACDPVSLTQTERAALARTSASKAHTALVGHLVAMVRHAAAANKIILTHNPIEEPPLCNQGLGREGADEWSKCGGDGIAEPDRGGLCLRCSRAEGPWRTINGLPPRRPGFARDRDNAA